MYDLAIKNSQWRRTAELERLVQRHEIPSFNSLAACVIKLLRFCVIKLLRFSEGGWQHVPGMLDKRYDYFLMKLYVFLVHETEFYVQVCCETNLYQFFVSPVYARYGDPPLWGPPVPTTLYIYIYIEIWGPGGGGGQISSVIGTGGPRISGDMGIL